MHTKHGLTSLFLFLFYFYINPIMPKVIPALCFYGI